MRSTRRVTWYAVTLFVTASQICGNSLLKPSISHDAETAFLVRIFDFAER